MSNLETGGKKKRLEPEGLPKRNTVPVSRLSSPPDPKENSNFGQFDPRLLVYIGQNFHSRKTIKKCCSPVSEQTKFADCCIQITSQF